MLNLTIPSTEMYDEVNEKFVYIKEQKICLEHSLVSMSKWESKYHKPFLSRNGQTITEFVDYVKFMTLTQNVKEEVYNIIMFNEDLIQQIRSYIDDPMTATWINEEKGAPSRNIVTSELIYYYMTALNIPFECQKWHLNRLITLIRVCSEKNKPPKKMSKRDIMRQNHSLNAARHARRR